MSNAAQRIAARSTVQNKAPFTPEDQKSAIRQQLGEKAWHSLAAQVRARFGQPPMPGEVWVFKGKMRVVEASKIGWFLAQASKLIGAPVTAKTGKNIPVEVRYFHADGGLVWDRRYSFAQKTVVARTTKTTDKKGRFVERFGQLFGITAGVTLALSEEHSTLNFRSHDFFFQAGRFVLRLPIWLSPGKLHVRHEALGAEKFRFTLTVTHPLFGRVFHQDGVFSKTGD